MRLDPVDDIVGGRGAGGKPDDLCGRGSNNTRELAKTCARYCARVHHVQTEADIRAEWFAAAEVVGLTAGTSTPDDVIDRVEAHIGRIKKTDSRGTAEESSAQGRKVTIGS
jgi:4-hydroxy-3-methylbut-2-enyl diphosphate reductase IspH